jgi:hypothetical protein
VLLSDVGRGGRLFPGPRPSAVEAARGLLGYSILKVRSV